MALLVGEALLSILGLLRAACGAGCCLLLLARLLVQKPEVLIDPAWAVAQLAVDDRILVVGHALHQVAVVRDEDQRPGPLVQQALHNREHVRVEVIARLVEHEHVGLLEQHAEQCQTAALAPGEVANVAGKVRPAKAQPLGELRGALGLAVDVVGLPEAGK